ncbi:MAG: PH domain-containing protein [Deltaproteobacteria bacterium]|nr:PH domain-containing protein [Deltaproteobacteria bacterium]
MASETSPGRQLHWRSLHPLSPLVNLLPRLIGAVRSAWPVGLAILFGRGGRLHLLDAALLSLPLVFAGTGSMLHWLTLRWRVVDRRLEIRTGLLTRQVRVIAADRVQHVASVQRLTHRLTGLVELEVETAAGREVEGLLSALSRADAEELVAGLGHPSAPPPAAAAAAPSAWYRNDVSDLFRYGATGTRWGLALFVFGIGFEIAQWQDSDRLAALASTLGPVGGAAGLLALLTGTWLVSTGAAMMRHWGFSLVERGDSLVAEEGLFTRRRVEIRPGKVQLVAVHEPWLRRMMGIATVVASTAAARSRAGGTEQAEALVPVVYPDGIGPLLHRLLPEIPLDPSSIERHPAHPRARLRALGGAAFRSTLIGGGIAAFTWPWGVVALLVGVPVAVLFAELGFRAQRWAVTSELVLAEGGWWRRTAVAVPRAKVQVVWLTAGPLMRMRGLARLTVAVAGGQISLPLLDATMASHLAEEIRVPLRPPRTSPPTEEDASGSPPPPPRTPSPPDPTTHPGSRTAEE